MIAIHRTWRRAARPLLLVGILLLVHSLLAAEPPGIEKDIQIRVFADRGVKLPDGSTGGAVQIYGMLVQEDGSEEVVWKTFLFQFHGLLFDHKYEYLPLDSETVYLYVPAAMDDREFVAMHRKTGEVTRTGGHDGEYLKLKREHIWYSMVIVDRPVVNNIQPQRIAPLEDRG